ncbi:hypothetical protein C4J65_09725 [Streptomyces sp. CB09001]|uniref:hypothetical protein n=1 Tax=Streptomyces sp. CB09001 TaxID=2083284 RepID=UPI000E2143B5|nr:hypothetical protein [Streptomyces sp. CB09001]AXL88577.1 hypothetical protein C4J65_09725 [Streptomyces sp. CB09001]
MTARWHVCRYCDEPIPDPDDAVLVAHEGANSGPGWNIWAHRAHADLVEPDSAAVRILARVLLVQAMRS